MNILVVNDDGIYAPGLAALADALQSLGEVQVVAPLTEQSGVGLGITYRQPLQAREEFRDGKHFGWAVSGSPADCVKLGVAELCLSRPDLIVSGINSGANTGVHVLYSGTVAGAIEGAFFGITSIAVSLAMDSKPDYALASRRAIPLIEQIISSTPDAGTLWNINLPKTRLGQPKGVKVVPLAIKQHNELIEKRIDPRGNEYYWSCLDPMDNPQREPGTDSKELADGYATITPLNLDMTCQPLLSKMENETFQLPASE